MQTLKFKLITKDGKKFSSYFTHSTLNWGFFHPMDRCVCVYIYILIIKYIYIYRYIYIYIYMIYMSFIIYFGHFLGYEGIFVIFRF